MTDVQCQNMEAIQMLFLPVASAISMTRTINQSKLRTLNVRKRVQTISQAIPALVERDSSAPAISLSQDDASLIGDVWDDLFLATACVVEGISAEWPLKAGGYGDDYAYS